MDQEDWLGAYLLLRVSAPLSRRSALLARLARAALEVGKFRIALEYLEKAVTLSGASRYLEVQLAAALLQKGYSRSARERIDAVLISDPVCARAHVISGAIHRSESNDDLAIESLERAIGSAESRATAALACWRLANVYKDCGRREEVIDLCLRSIAIDGDFAPAYYELAHIGYYRDPAHPHLAKMEGLLRDRRLTRDKRAGLNGT